MSALGISVGGTELPAPGNVNADEPPDLKTCPDNTGDALDGMPTVVSWEPPDNFNRLRCGAGSATATRPQSLPT